MCPCYSNKTHYPPLENPVVQNIAVCESQVKQHESSDHWTSIKTIFLEKTTRDDAKKTKRLTEVQVLTKDCTSSKIRHESLRKTK